MLLILSSFGWINAVPPVVFYNKGAVQVATNGTMYVKGGMHMASEVVSGTVVSDAVVTQKGLTVLTGDFIHDASSNVFTTIYGASSNPVTGTVEFRGNTDQMVTTRLEAYTPAQTSPARLDQMDRSTQYLKFPNFKINNTKRVIITPSMGVSVNNLDFTSGRLRLKSDKNSIAEHQDASLLVAGVAFGYQDSLKNVICSGNFMEIERNTFNIPGDVNSWTLGSRRAIGFAAPLKDMYYDYFSNHVVEDLRITPHPKWGYRLHRPWVRFTPGLGYFAAIRQVTNTEVDGDYLEDGMPIINEKFVFGHTFYPDFFKPSDNVVSELYPCGSYPWNKGVDQYNNCAPLTPSTKGFPWEYEWQDGISMDNPEGVPQPQETLNTGDVPVSLVAGSNYLGNPYTCALDVDALFEYWKNNCGAQYGYEVQEKGDNFYPWVRIWDGKINNYLFLGYGDGMTTLDGGERIIPAQQLFVIYANAAVLHDFKIPASARTHNPHRFMRAAQTPLRNELLIEVMQKEVIKGSRMAIGLRSWGKESGDDRSDVKFTPNNDIHTPLIYATVPEKKGSATPVKLSINSLPEEIVSTDFDFVPMQIEGTYKYVMKFSRWESLETEIVLLRDNATGVLHNIRKDGAYEFEAKFETGEGSDFHKRFTIMFKYPNQIEDSNILPRDAYFYGQTLNIIYNQESDIRKPVEIYNTSGLLIYRNEINQTGTNSYELNLVEGVYIVRSGEMVKKIKK